MIDKSQAYLSFADFLTDLEVEDPAQEGFFKDVTSKLKIPVSDLLSIELFKYKSKPMQIKSIYSKEDFVYLTNLFNDKSSYTVGHFFGMVDVSAIAQECLKHARTISDAETAFNATKREILETTRLALAFITEVKRLYTKAKAPNEKSIRAIRKAIIARFEHDEESLKAGIKIMENADYEEAMTTRIQHDKFDIWPVVIPSKEEYSKWKEYQTMRFNNYQVYCNAVQSKLKPKAATENPVESPAEEAYNGDFKGMHATDVAGKKITAHKAADDHNNLVKTCEKVKNTISKMYSEISRDLRERSNRFKADSDDFSAKRCDETEKKAHQINSDAQAVKIVNSPKSALSTLMRYFTNIRNIASQNKIEVALASYGFSNEDFQMAVEAIEDNPDIAEESVVDDIYDTLKEMVAEEGPVADFVSSKIDERKASRQWNSLNGDVLSAINNLGNLAGHARLRECADFSKELRKYSGVGREKSEEEYHKMNKDNSELIIKYAKLANSPRTKADELKKEWNDAKSLKTENEVKSKAESIINKAEKEHQDILATADKLLAERDNYKEHMQNMEKSLPARKEELAAQAKRKREEEIEKHDKALRDFSSHARPAMASAVELEVEDVAALEGIQGTDISDVLWYGAGYAVGATVGYLLFSSKITNQPKHTVGGYSGLPGSGIYHLLLSDEFKKSEKALKKLLKDKRKFIIEKDVLKEILEIKNQYFKLMAYSVNKFLDTFDELEELIGKEKDYAFTVANTSRDEALNAKLHKQMSLVLELMNGDMFIKATRIHEYKPKYLSHNSDEGKMSIDSAYLTKLLNPNETFRMIHEIDRAISKLPEEGEVSKLVDKYRAMNKERYHELPISTYIALIANLAELARTTRGILCGYIAQVYAVLDFCIPSDGKGIAKESLEDTSAVAVEGISDFMDSEWAPLALVGTYALFLGILSSFAEYVAQGEHYGYRTYEALLGGDIGYAKTLYLKTFPAKKKEYIVNKRLYDVSTVLLRKYEKRGLDALRGAEEIHKILEDLMKNKKKYKSGDPVPVDLIKIMEKLKHAEDALIPITEDDIMSIAGPEEFGPKDPSMNIDKKYLEERINFNASVKNIEKLAEYCKKAPKPDKFQLFTSYKKKGTAIKTYDDRFETMDASAAWLKVVYRMNDYLTKATEIYGVSQFLRFCVLAHIQ